MLIASGMSYKQLSQYTMPLNLELNKLRPKLGHRSAVEYDEKFLIL